MFDCNFRYFFVCYKFNSVCKRELNHEKRKKDKLVYQSDYHYLHCRNDVYEIAVHVKNKEPAGCPVRQALCFGDMQFGNMQGDFNDSAIIPQ